MVKQPQTTDKYVQARITEYLARAHRVLKTGNLALADGDYITAVNRAYYAIFYSANALLTTKGLERSKHSGVIAAFRQHFVKIGIRGGIQRLLRQRNGRPAQWRLYPGQPEL